MSENLPEKKSSVLLDDQPSLVEDSPASHTVLRENVKRLVMTVISGQNSGESFGRLDPDGCYLKTSQGSIQANLDGFLEKCSGMWPQWGTLLDGELGELSISELRTGENGSSLLPTITTQEVEHPEMTISETGRRIKENWKDSHSIGLADRIAMLPTLNTCDATMGTLKGKEFVGNKHAMKLEQAINLLPTPRSREAGNYQYSAGDHNKPTLTLSGKIAMLPTPTSRDFKDTGKMENVPVNSLLGRELGKNHGLKLQPAFAEWMMGFPIGYTDLPLLETQSSRSKSIRSSKRLQTLKQQREQMMRTKEREQG